MVLMYLYSTYSRMRTHMHRIGIIPFAIKNNDVAILFVTSQTRGRWILPKGRQKTGETHIETCHREGFEEAGVRGVVLEDFPLTGLIGKSMKEGLKNVPVTYYPYLVNQQEDSWPEEEKRQRHWALIDDAAKVAYREDYLEIVKSFSVLRPWIIEALEANKT